MRHSVYHRYREAEILSASPLHLVCLLYRGAIEAIATARQCLAGRDIAGRSRAVNKALKITTELIFTLDHQKGAELSRKLVELYDYVQRLLIDANCRQADAPMAEAQTLMVTLLEAWETCESASVAQDLPLEEGEYVPVSCAG
jgi:flagellar protein FliS